MVGGIDRARAVYAVNHGQSSLSGGAGGHTVKRGPEAEKIVVQLKEAPRGFRRVDILDLNLIKLLLCFTNPSTWK